MTAAIFRATYHTDRDVASRNVRQIVLEVPSEETEAVLKVLGKRGSWVAVARLDPSTAQAGQAKAAEAGDATKASDREAGHPQKTKQPPQRWQEMKLSQRAGIICGEPEFWVWAQSRGPYGIKIETPAHAADWLRWKTNVTSRKQYDTYAASGRLYREVETAYLTYKQDLRYGTDTPPPDPHPEG